MKIHYILLGTLFILLVALGMMDYLAELGDNYGTTADLDGLNETKQKLNDTQQRAQDVKDRIDAFKLENIGDFFAIPYRMIRAGWSSLRLMFTGMSTIQTMTEETGKEISDTVPGIPNYVIPTLVAMIITVVTAIIIYTFLKWKAEN